MLSAGVLGETALPEFEGGLPYCAPSPLSGACFAKASQPEGAEDMSKGARGGRFWIRDEIAHAKVAKVLVGPMGSIDR